MSFILTPDKLSAYTQLIEDNPVNFQDQISQLKTNFPTDLGSIVPKSADLLNSIDKDSMFNRMEAYKKMDLPFLPPMSLASGMEIILADPNKNNFFADTEAHVNNFFKLIGSAGEEIINFPAEIKNVVGSVSDLSKGFVSNISNALTDKLVVFVQKGLQGLKDFFFATIPEKLTAIATTIGVQSALIAPVKALFGKMECLVQNVMTSLTGAIEDMITGMVRNIVNTPVCAAQQFVGALTHKITNVIDFLVGPFLGPIEKLMSPIGAVFKIKDAIMGGLNIADKLSSFFKCNPPVPPIASAKMLIDGGLKKDSSEKDQQSSIDKVFGAANNAFGRIKDAKDGLLDGIDGGLSNFEKNYGEWEIFGTKVKNAKDQGIGDCSNTGNEFNCGMPSIEFFGGDGLGGAGKVLMGNFINRFDKEDILGDIEKVGSIVGVDITNPGQAYTEPPLVAFSDSCDKGYGAYGKAIIDSNMNSPTYGQIVAITITSPGENYPVDQETDLYVEQIIVEDPGSGYEEGDTIDNFEICGLNSNGGITCVKPNNQPYRDLPRLKVNTITGQGAVLRPIMTRVIPQTKVVEVIDCVT